MSQVTHESVEIFLRQTALDTLSLVQMQGECGTSGCRAVMLTSFGERCDGKKRLQAKPIDEGSCELTKLGFGLCSPRPVTVVQRLEVLSHLGRELSSRTFLRHRRWHCQTLNEL